MSWFNTSSITTLAKSALNQAQKTIDKALDIRDDPGANLGTSLIQSNQGSSTKPIISSPKSNADDEFFSSFGLEGTQAEEVPMDSPSKNVDHSLWGSFTGSFFEPGAEKPVPPQSKKRPTTNVTGKRLRIGSFDEHGRSESFSSISTSNSMPDVSKTCIEDDVPIECALVREQPKGKAVPCEDHDLLATQTLTSCSKTEAGANCELQRNVEAGIVSLESSDTQDISLLTEKTRSAADVKAAQPSSIETTLTTDDERSELEEELDVKKSKVDQSWDESWASSSFSFASGMFSGNFAMDRIQSELTEKSGDRLSLLSSESKLGSTSLCSVSSSSTTGESSSTLDESVGTLSVVSEKDRRSSATLTPDLFIDSSDSTSLPIGMSSSWDDGVSSNVPPCEVTSNTVVENADAEVSADRIESTEVLPCLETATETPETEVCRDETGEEHTSEGCDIRTTVGEKTLSIGQETVDTSESLPNSSSSFVCYMLEAAMEESVEVVRGTRAHSPNSTTSSTSSVPERSDPVNKTADSEQNSGHTSGDEIETTTSSDIEIISSPSGGGESGCERGGSLSPIKQSSLWRSKTGGNSDRISGPCRHQGSSIRSESPASDTSSTKDSIPVQFGLPSFLRPDLSFVQVSSSKGGGHQRKPSEASSEESEGNAAKIEAVMKKLTEMNTILEARETKVLELSQENVVLREKGIALKAQLQKAQEVRAADNRDVSSLTREFTERLSSTETKLQHALKEKESLKHDLQEANQEISTRVSLAQVEEMQREKDCQIAELMQEGEKLSKQLLIYSNNVKKLRAKEKENETHIKQQREKLEEQSRELDCVRKALGAKEEVEKNQIELIRQLTNSVQKLEKQLATVKSDLEDVQEKHQSGKVALDSAYKELAELHRKNVEKDSQAQEAALSAEMVAKEELKACLERVQHETRLQQESLLLQVEDLRMSLMRSEQQSGRREDTLRQDIASLQERLQEAEGRNDELNQNVSAATRPLLRQIDNLQSTLNMNTSSWERVERNLTDRLNEVQNQLAYATEKERAATERYAEISSKVASLEAQCSLLRQERVKLQAKLKTLEDELQLAQESQAKDTVLFDAIKQSFNEDLSRLKREKGMLEHQLEIERTALEAEKRKTALLQDQLKEKDHRLSQITTLDGSRRNSPSPQGSISMQGSFSEHFQSAFYPDDVSESGSTFPGMPASRMNVYESLRAGSTATLLDSLQSQLKLRDGDIAQLQGNISQLERVKESMTQELVKLTSQNEEMLSSIVLLQEQADQYQDMQQKYNALLQMYGEKSEEAAELRLDLQDVKDMYKAQIDVLLRKGNTN